MSLPNSAAGSEALRAAPAGCASVPVCTHESWGRGLLMRFAADLLAVGQERAVNRHRAFVVGAFEAVFSPLGPLLHFEGQSVIGELDIWRQLCVGCVVLEVVIHVHEKCLLGADALCDLDGLVKAHVGGVGAIAQCARDEHLDTLENGEGFLWNGAHVGEPGKARESKTDDALRSVKNGHRPNSDSPHHKIPRDLVEIELWNASAWGRWLEAIGETTLNLGEAFGRAVEVDWMPMDHVEGAKVVESSHMIGVRMRNKDKVDVLHSVGQCLRAEICAAIDEEAVTQKLDVGACAHPFIFWVRAATHSAAATQSGDPG